MQNTDYTLIWILIKNISKNMIVKNIYQCFLFTTYYGSESGSLLH